MSRPKSKSDNWKSGNKERVAPNATVDPGYASWIRNVIAPALVEKYLKKLQDEQQHG